MGKIRNRFKNNKKIYAFVKVMKLMRKGTAWRVLKDYATNPKMLTFHCYGVKNPEKKFYHITIGNSMTGMCSLLTWTLRKLEFADFFCLTPYVTWKKNVTVADRNSDRNPFELYFRQVSDISLEELYGSSNVAKSRELDLVYGDRIKSYNFSEDEIDRLSSTYRKHIKLQDGLNKRIQDDMDSLFVNRTGKILAVHVRGVDWRKKQIDGHPVAASEDYYVRLVDIFLQEHSYEKIFLATDSENTIEMFKLHFKDKVLFYSDVNRTSKDGDSLVIFDGTRNTVDMGYEILRDVYTLAHCDSIIAGVSYVSYIARIIKKSKKENYEVQEIVDKGMATNAYTLSKDERRQRASFTEGSISG